MQCKGAYNQPFCLDKSNSENVDPRTGYATRTGQVWLHESSGKDGATGTRMPLDDVTRMFSTTQKEHQVGIPWPATIVGPLRSLASRQLASYITAVHTLQTITYIEATVSMHALL